MSTLSKRRRPSFQLGLLGAIALFLVLGPGLNGISGSSYAQTEALPITDQAPISRQNVLTLPLQLNPNDNDNYNRQLIQSMDEQDMNMERLSHEQLQEGGSGDDTLQLYKSHSHHSNLIKVHRTSGPKMDRQHWDFVHLASKVSGKSDHRVNQRLQREWEKQELRLRKANAKKANKIKSAGLGRASKNVSRQEQPSTQTKKAIKAQQAGPVEAKPKAMNQAVRSQGTIKSGKTSPAIFYVPHQDDDALAMALVHLYSDGINAMLRDIVAGAVPCPLQHPPHRFNLTLSDVVTGRTHEFRQSLRALGVQDRDIYETGWSDIEPLKNYPAFKLKLRELIVGYERKYPGASHKCISGEYDRDSVGRNPTHRACWDVATDLLNEFPRGYPVSKQLWDFRFYRTYTYYNPPTRRSAQYIRALPRYLGYKQHALDQYKRWDPSKGELAWGYHSVKSLIDAAYNDEHVYMDMLDNDPTNPENWSSGGRNKAELEVIHNTEGEATMFPDTLDNLQKDTNIMLFRAEGEEGEAKMTKSTKHGKIQSQKKGNRVQGHGGGVKERERIEKQAEEETHVFGDYDIDESGLEAKMGGQSVDTDSYESHDVHESGLKASPKDTNLRLSKEKAKKMTFKKHGKSRSQQKGSRAQEGHGAGVKANERIEKEAEEETHIFGDYDIDESGLEAKLRGQGVGTNAYHHPDVGESGLKASPKDTNLRLSKEKSKKMTFKKHGKSRSQQKGSRAQEGHGAGVKANERIEKEAEEETHIFGDYDIDESGLESKMRGQGVGTNSYEDHGVDDSEMETLLATQPVKKTHAYGDYDIDDSQLDTLMESYKANKARLYHDFDLKETKVAAAPENTRLLAKQQGPNEQDQLELSEGRNKDQILKQFEAATKRPEGQDYKVNIRHGSSIVLGLVKSDSVE
ncbi:hypothetical protein BGZ68_008487 [Mortierella alpina]|nr:hypothetical protein BGZ68_008487 [Mortierella alpina]